MSSVFSGLLTLDLSSFTFEPFREGVEIAHLHRSDSGDGPALALLAAPTPLSHPGVGVAFLLALAAPIPT